MALFSVCLPISAIVLWIFLGSVISWDSHRMIRLRRDAIRVENINELVDRIVPDITQQIQNWSLDPLNLGTLNTEDLSECSVRGISTVYRSGNCYITFVNSDQAVLHADIGFQRIEGSCRFTKRLWLFTYDGMIVMRMRNMTSFLRINQPMEQNAHPTLEYLDVEVPEGMVLEAYGDGAVSLVIDTFKLLYRRRMKHLVRDTLRERFRQLLTEYMNQIDFAHINSVLNEQGHLQLFQ